MKRMEPAKNNNSIITYRTRQSQIYYKGFVEEAARRRRDTVGVFLNFIEEWFDELFYIIFCCMIW